MCAIFTMKNLFQSKSYAHLDKHKHPECVEELIKDQQWVASHGFLPLIHVQMKLKKRNGCQKPFSFKIRHIFYSSHTDSYIYQWYAHILSASYEKYVKNLSFYNVPTAYRSLNGKCNIDFAKEAFDFVKKQEDAFIFVTDFHSFFDSLDHKILKQNLMKVLEMPKGLEPDWYAIYKSLVKATYFDLDEIAKIKNTERKLLRKKESCPSILLNQREMRKLKHQYLHNYYEIIDENSSHPDKTKIGIPQGTSLSALFANTYMIDFDKTISDYVNTVNGFYRRYSDDIFIVVPFSEKEKLCTLFETERQKINIEISTNKTRRFHIKDGKIVDIIKCPGESTDSRLIIEYLGFSYDGNHVLIKDGSLNKFYKKLNNRLYLLKRLKKEKGKYLGLKRFYRLYSHLGEAARIHHNKTVGLFNKDFRHSNFITYVNKSASIMKEPKIKHQLKKHWKHISEGLKK